MSLSTGNADWREVAMFTRRNTLKSKSDNVHQKKKAFCKKMKTLKSRSGNVHKKKQKFLLKTLQTPLLTGVKAKLLLIKVKV